MLRYPNFPGFSTPFLEWLFDTHDLNNDGSLTQAEFTSASKSMYPAPLAPDNWLKNTDDGIAARTPQPLFSYLLFMRTTRCLSCRRLEPAMVTTSTPYGGADPTFRTR